MSIQLDTTDDTLWFDGKKVGKIEKSDSDGKLSVTLSLTYRCSPGEEHFPLIAFATELAKLDDYKEKPPPAADLTVEMPLDSIEKTFDVPRLLTEKTIKAAGYVWEFHKTDVDPWPSQLHGHDYEHGLKVDALTGDVFDVGTRALFMRLKKKYVNEMQDALRRSKDFGDTAQQLLDK